MYNSLASALCDLGTKDDTLINQMLLKKYETIEELKAFANNFDSRKYPVEY